jgi:stress-induced morphogen
MRKEDIVAKIRAALPDAEVELRDLTGTADHWEATIVSAAFEGRSLVERHRLVNQSLAEELKGPIHALTLKTYTPAQARERAGAGS